jgi:thymidine phosphorylase
MELGGGRRVEADAIDPAVGLSEIAATGEAVGPGGRPLCVVHARGSDAAETAAARVRAAIRVGAAAPAERPVVTEELS